LAVSRQSYFPEAIAATVLAVAIASAAACTIDTPTFPDGGDGLPEECSRYADLLVVYTPPDQEEGSGEDGERVLGAPDGEGVELAVDGVLTVGFIGAGGIEDGDDEDIRVHASGDDGAEITAYVSEAEGEYVFVGVVTAEESELDISVSRARVALYLRLVGTAGTMTVDAVEAIRDICDE
jgi:hypothetical protein